jgi:hypothetical protein
LTHLLLATLVARPLDAGLAFLVVAVVVIINAARAAVNVGYACASLALGHRVAVSRADRAGRAQRRGRAGGDDGRSVHALGAEATGHWRLERGTAVACRTVVRIKTAGNLVCCLGPRPEEARSEATGVSGEREARRRDEVEFWRCGGDAEKAWTVKRGPAKESKGLVLLDMVTTQ